MTDWLDPSECTCECHRIPNVDHAIACCAGLPMDFWERYYEPFFIGNESSKPKRRSENYEAVEDWMGYIHSKKTGKPLAGPGSDRTV